MYASEETRHSQYDEDFNAHLPSCDVAKTLARRRPVRLFIGALERRGKGVRERGMAGLMNERFMTDVFAFLSTILNYPKF